MARTANSNPAGQVVPELVEILRQLGAHRRAVHEQTYGNPPWTREQSDAYFYHPLVRACDWLEQRAGISRYDLEDAAFRLTTPQGLRGMDPLTGPGGRTTDAGQPDLLWMISKFRELDGDKTTARLWQLLAEEYPAILEEAMGRPAFRGASKPPSAQQPFIRNKDKSRIQEYEILWIMIAHHFDVDFKIIPEAPLKQKDFADKLEQRFKDKGYKFGSSELTVKRILNRLFECDGPPENNKGYTEYCRRCNDMNFLKTWLQLKVGKITDAADALQSALRTQNLGTCKAKGCDIQATHELDGLFYCDDCYAEKSEPS